jgi:hypothetical protein
VGTEENLILLEKYSSPWGRRLAAGLRLYWRLWCLPARLRGKVFRTFGYELNF